MKRVRVMLSAIAVLAVVGGAVAFKAKKDGATICTYVKTLTTGQCTLSGITTFKTTTTLGNNFIAVGPTVLRNGVPECVTTDQANFPLCTVKRTIEEE